MPIQPLLLLLPECNHAHLGCKLWTILWAKYKSACHTSCVPQSGPTEQIELMANRVFAAHRNPKMDTMRQLRKSTEETVRDIWRAARWHSPRRRSESSSKARVARTASLSSAAMKVSPKTSIADGPTETLEAGKKRFAVTPPARP